MVTARSDSIAVGMVEGTYVVCSQVYLMLSTKYAKVFLLSVCAFNCARNRHLKEIDATRE